MKSILWCAVLISALARGAAVMAQTPEASVNPAPDDRYKADILLIVAHPDDETALGSYLARAVFDEGHRVAIVYCNRGEGGGNSHGNEQSTALGAVREIEARRATAEFGITNVWFLSGRDTPGQDLFRSLEVWGHGKILEDVIRLLRLTRPEVVMTWLPHFVSGENHGDHQASGVIATEAFDMAGDPTVFPAQVAVPRERADINNSSEGLIPWQAKKLFFVSDASHEVLAEGPPFDPGGVSPSQKVSYDRLAMRLHTPHLTQGDVSRPALDAVKSGDFKKFSEWLGKFHLIFGKSIVPTSPTAGVFDGIGKVPAPFVPPRGFAAKGPPQPPLAFGGVFEFYREFWAAHDIDRVASLVPPEIEVAAGSYLFIPLVLHNATAQPMDIVLTSTLPQGWKEAAGSGRFTLAPGESRPVQTFIQCPAAAAEKAQNVVWSAGAKGTALGTATMSVRLVEWSLPQ
jgi:LmbE family N-acetylglucosaminyl deacetylase